MNKKKHFYQHGYQDSMNDTITYVQQLVTTTVSEKDKRREFNEKIQQHYRQKTSEIKAKTDISRILNCPLSLKHQSNSSPRAVNPDESPTTTESSLKETNESACCSQWAIDDDCSAETMDDMLDNENKRRTSSSDEDRDSFTESEKRHCENIQANTTTTQMAIVKRSQNIMSTMQEQQQQQQPSQTQSPNNVQVSTSAPIFVLHPSGTHYVPMIIDSALVAHAFEPPFTKKQLAQDKNQQQQQQAEQRYDSQQSLLCHPITIPVNFRRSEDLYPVYETQNVNVVQCRHHSSVEPK